MIINLFSRAVPAIALFCATALMAQNYQTMPIASGFTADVIANGVGSSVISTNNDVDGVSYAFVARDFQLTIQVRFLRMVFLLMGLLIL
jgi:hypothetical protein